MQRRGEEATIGPEMPHYSLSKRAKRREGYCKFCLKCRRGGYHKSEVPEKRRLPQVPKCQSKKRKVLKPALSPQKE